MDTVNEGRRHDERKVKAHIVLGEVEVDLLDIVQWLSLFYMDEPVIAYLSTEKALSVYDDNVSEYKKFANVLLDIIKLSEHIPLQARAFSKLPIIADLKGAPCILPITGETVAFRPHNIWVFPLMASLKPALDTSTDPFSWRTDPFKLFSRLAPQLLGTVNESYDGLKNSYKVLAQTVKDSL